MAEFESGYCTGCGYPSGRKGLMRGVHRPYCWRKVTMLLDVPPTDERVRKLIQESKKHWRVLSRIVSAPKHRYYAQFWDTVGESP